MNIKIDSIMTVVASALLIGTLITGCQDISYPAPQPSTAAPITAAQVRFVNATADASSITSLLENTPVGNALGLGQATDYVNVPFLGSLQLRIKGTGGTLGSGDISTKSSLTINGAYTAFVTDSVNRPVVKNVAGIVTDVGGSRLSVVYDPLSQTLTAGAGGVRFFDFVPDAGLPSSSTSTSPLNVSVRVSPATSTTALPTATASFLNRVYRNVSTVAFTSVPAGSYRVDAFTGVTLPNSTTVSPIASSTLNVMAGKFYTLYANGSTRRKTAIVSSIQHN